ncbi:hypothetical protein OG21DRAFT_1528272, partial [Imleria badia]
LKRKYRTIDCFKNGTGHGWWSVTHGADISDSPEEHQLWDDFMRTSDDAKEMAPHRNTGWPFFVGMEELLSQSSAAEGYISMEGLPEPELELDYTAQDNESKQYFSTSTTDLSSFGDPADAASSQSMLGSTSLPDYNLDLDYLFNIGRDLTSPDPITQFAAVHEALSVVNKTSVASPSTSQSHTFSSAESANRTFSDMPYPHPPSTQTSLSSAPINLKGKKRACTPAVSNRPPSIISSAGISKHSKLKVTTQTQNMSTAVAMTGMTGTLNWAMDCMKGMQELLVAPTASPFTPPLPASIQPTSFRSLATAHLNNDPGLDVTIHAKLALEFLSNESLCQMYAELTDPMDWYQDKYGKSMGTSSVLTFFPGHDKGVPAATAPSSSFVLALYGNRVLSAEPSTNYTPSSVPFTGHHDVTGNPPAIGVLSDHGDTGMDYDAFYDTSYLDTSGPYH